MSSWQWKQLWKTILFITHDVEEAIFLSQKILVITGHPVTGLMEFTVPMPKERNREMLLLPETARLKEDLIALLRREAKAEGTEGAERIHDADEAGIDR